MNDFPNSKIVWVTDPDATYWLEMRGSAGHWVHGESLGCWARPPGSSGAGEWIEKSAAESAWSRGEELWWPGASEWVQHKVVSEPQPRVGPVRSFPDPDYPMKEIEVDGRRVFVGPLVSEHLFASVMEDPGRKRSKPKVIDRLSFAADFANRYSKECGREPCYNVLQSDVSPSVTGGTLGFRLPSVQEISLYVDTAPNNPPIPTVPRELACSTRRHPDGGLSDHLNAEVVDYWQGFRTPPRRFPLDSVNTSYHFRLAFDHTLNNSADCTARNGRMTA